MANEAATAACKVAASTEIMRLPEIAQEAWAHYEGVPDDKKEHTKIRHAFMTGFLAAQAAAKVIEDQNNAAKVNPDACR